VSWTIDLACAKIFGMRRLSCLVAVFLLGMACSKGLQVGAVDAARETGGAGDCVGPPPEACGYSCVDGVWFHIPLLCPPDGGFPAPGDQDAQNADLGNDMVTLDSAPTMVADGAPACVPATSNDAGPTTACPCLRTSGCPAGGPYGLDCHDDGLACDYVADANACGIVSCVCKRDDVGLHWECYVLLH